MCSNHNAIKSEAAYRVCLGSLLLYFLLSDTNEKNTYG